MQQLGQDAWELVNSFSCQTLNLGKDYQGTLE